MELNNRISSLDHFRGTAVLLMTFANALAGYQLVPAWLKHAFYNGFTLPDIVMPMFLFAIGYAMEISFQYRVQKKGALRTMLTLFRRNAILIVFGFLGTLLVHDYGWWGVLEALGLTGLLAVPLMFIKPVTRLIISAVILAAYQVTVSLFSGNVIGIFLVTGLGGPYGSLSWLFILVSGSCLSAWLKERPYVDKIVGFTLAGILLIVLGLAINVFVPFNKHLVSSSYVLLSSGICAYALMLLTALTDQFRKRIPPLEVLGKNALLMYIVSNLLILLMEYLLPTGAGLWMVLCGFGAVTILTWLAAFLLDRFKIYIRL